jgi:hypothetical protein
MPAKTYIRSPPLPRVAMPCCGPIRAAPRVGKAFHGAIAKELGGMDFQDVMSGVDHVIRIGLADPGPTRRDGLELWRLPDCVDNHTRPNASKLLR